MFTLFFCFFIAGPLRAEPAEENSFRVMTWNMRYDTLADGRNAWPLRREKFAAAVESQAPDLIVFQEALKHQIDYLAEKLPQYSWYGVGRDDGAEKGEYVPIFYRTDRFEPREKGTFWLCEEPDQPGRLGWDAACPRLATWMILRDKRSQRELLLVGTHLDHMGATAREKSAELLLRRMATHAPLPMILAGDFNCRDDSRPHQILTGQADRPEGEAAPPLALADAKTVPLQGHDGPDSTWNGFQRVLPGQRIDFLFVGGAIQVVKHRILAPAEGEPFLSDHLPVEADIQWVEPAEKPEFD